MSSTKVQPIVLDCKNLRVMRQEENDKKAFDQLLDTNITEQNMNACNINEIQRMKKKLNCSTFEELRLKCITNYDLALVLSTKISKNASRQGTTDETLVFEKCNETTIQFGIEIRQLDNKYARPTKCGKVIINNNYKQYGLCKNDCLKSFDAKITGLINGYIFAKITYSSGGFQDNVFEEAHCMGDWFITYGNQEELYILLIDTDLTFQFNQLRDKYHKKNILVVDHIQLQQYFIDKFDN